MLLVVETTTTTTTTYYLKNTISSDSLTLHLSTNLRLIFITLNLQL